MRLNGFFFGGFAGVSVKSRKGTVCALGMVKPRPSSPAVSCELWRARGFEVGGTRSPAVGVFPPLVIPEMWLFWVGVRLKLLKTAVSCECCSNLLGVSTARGVPSFARYRFVSMSDSACNGSNCPVLNFSGDASTRRLRRLLS